MILAASPTGVGVGFEWAYERRFPWLPTLLLWLCFILCGCGLVTLFIAGKKKQREIEQGYTMWKDMAGLDKGLYYVTRDTLEVISGPGQPRPGEEGYMPRSWSKP